MKLKINNLSFSYDKTDFFRELSLELSGPGFFSIIGPNGVGKSTLLKLLCGILNPTSGIISIDGYTVKQSSRHFNYVPQFFSFFKGFCAWDLLEAYFYSHLGRVGHISDEQKKYSLEIFELFKVSHLLERELITLSGGERQRILLGCALVKKPKILFLDEAFSALDIHSVEEIYLIMKKFQLTKELTIVNVDHNINFCLSYSDEIIALKEGTLLFHKKREEIKKQDLDQLYTYQFSYSSEQLAILPRADYE